MRLNLDYVEMNFIFSDAFTDEFFVADAVAVAYYRYAGCFAPTADGGVCFVYGVCSVVASFGDSRYFADAGSVGIVMFGAMENPGTLCAGVPGYISVSSIRFASSGGTAFPICMYCLVLVPPNRNSGG